MFLVDGLGVDLKLDEDSLTTGVIDFKQILDGQNSHPPRVQFQLKSTITFLHKDVCVVVQIVTALLDIRVNPSPGRLRGILLEAMCVA